MLVGLRADLLGEGLPPRCGLAPSLLGGRPGLVLDLACQPCLQRLDALLRVGLGPLLRLLAQPGLLLAQAELQRDP